MDREIIAKGERAKRLLASEDWKVCLGYIDSDLIAQFRATDVNEADERETIHKVMYWSDLFVDRLEKYVKRAEAEMNAAEQHPDA
jgi:hypothetical protein